ncbi:prolipoprotein diacylglyceryl transferase family protein [Pantanalinema sp. GBBB05]|uniref:prolipoprotein diacylglyceryl transferase family protein n=1 Tax=Pantanalinema sp. GBBB05 TaxID=2604139 RepID=UPI003D8142B3
MDCKLTNIDLKTSTLETLIRRSHNLRIFGWLYHPYHLAKDIGTIALLIFSAWWVRDRSQLSFFAFVGAFLSMQAVYLIVRLLKYQIWGIAERSYVQDSIFILLPTYALTSVALGNAIALAMDLAALDLALGVAFIRVGCFLGGCCYGRPAVWGVKYQEEQLVPVRGCRTYTPGPLPLEPVIPMQLFESVFNLVLFVALLVWGLLAPEQSDGKVLPVYFLAYGCWRFISDFWREASARPRRAGFSEAQWVSAIVVIVSLSTLFYLGRG